MKSKYVSTFLCHECSDVISVTLNRQAIVFLKRKSPSFFTNVLFVKNRFTNTDSSCINSWFEQAIEITVKWKIVEKYRV